ncbi:hypothetical protein KZ829_09220 [Actinoplanes hulinensis]|uniref:Lipoprotein n=1 Tax=Actinoplanes hulinensis TaxID=1144547 RepID=A0ABS7AYS1_9ACTN|nr:hypothetical protein [Actinoplanes hulinensis]MBW6433915.1 hypothetical protein [Actinoplanes hulinensis]
MNMRITRRAGAGVLLAAVLAAGGCGPAEPVGETASAPPSAPAKPKDATAALSAAAGELTRTTYRMSMDMAGQGTMTGLIDSNNKIYEYVMVNIAAGKTSTTTVRAVGGVTYVKVKMTYADGQPGAEGRWRKAAGDDGFGKLAGADIAESTRTSLASATDVQWVGADRVRGVVDLVEMIRANGEKPPAGARPGEAMMPFEASFDDQGRLASYRFTKAPESSAVKFFDFGVAVDIKAPPAAEIAAR